MPPASPDGISITAFGADGLALGSLEEVKPALNAVSNAGCTLLSIWHLQQEPTCCNLYKQRTQP